MIKAISRQVLEVFDTGNAYFEKAWLMVSPEFSSSDSERLEAEAEDYLIGIEPVAGYWYAKEREIDNVRIILSGILIGEEPEYMEKFLGNTYFD